MTRIVGVHGVRNFRYYRANQGVAAAAATAVSDDWSAWLRSGLLEGALVDLRVAYYAHHLHRGTPQGPVDDPTTLEPEAQDLLISWVEQLRPHPQIAQGPRTFRARQATDWLTRHYGPAVRVAAIAFCREVHTYLVRPDAPRRIKARDAVAMAIAEHRPSIVIAHSLGSVVAYEALWRHTETTVDLFVTFGSPLGMPVVVFDRLEPAPADGRGGRPPTVARWFNFADIGDIVAVPPDLPRRFQGIDHHVPNLAIGTWDFHSTKNYLACADFVEMLLGHLSC
jgi:hypothetical protein